MGEPLSQEPTPLDLEGMDFLDVGVGMDHLIVLSMGRRVFVVGAGGNGQLGLGQDVKGVKGWREVCLPLKEGQRVASVHAGYS